MAVKSIQTFTPRVPLDERRFYSSQCEFPQRNSLLVRIETDDGLVGWGEGGQYGPAEPVAEVTRGRVVSKENEALVKSTGFDKYEIYHISKDIGEMQDLSGNTDAPV